MKTKEEEVVDLFAAEIHGITPSSFVRDRPDGKFLIFEFAHPSDYLHRALNRTNDALTEDNPFKDRLAIATRRKKPAAPLETAETQLLQWELAASLTVDQFTFGEDFLSRYTASVTSLEQQIVVSTNHVVYGRRGSGKSSLMAYAMHHLKKARLPYCWLAMQTYAGRDDVQAIASALGELFGNLEGADGASEFSLLSRELLLLGEQNDAKAVDDKLKRLTPRMRQMLGKLTGSGKSLTVFLDDLHVLANDLQPKLLHFFYSLARGNRTYIKVSGIEQLTNLWDGIARQGMESPGDIQVLMLDHNLTSPDKSRDHIVNILDRHARYCGLPSIGYLAGERFLDRLVLAAAAVPRDALSLFAKSVAQSKANGQRYVSVTSLNSATSETIEEKLKDVERDVSGREVEVQAALEKVKRFCLNQQKKNSFLVKIVNTSDEYRNIQRLIALRFVHVLHGGMTPHKAGVRYVALMLDYGFYIGFRAAKSVELFPDRPRPLLAKELRRLPILEHQ